MGEIRIRRLGRIRRLRKPARPHIRLLLPMSERCPQPLHGYADFTANLTSLAQEILDAGVLAQATTAAVRRAAIRTFTLQRSGGGYPPSKDFVELLYREPLLKKSATTSRTTAPAFWTEVQTPAPCAVTWRCPCWRSSPPERGKQPRLHPDGNSAGTAPTGSWRPSIGCCPPIPALLATEGCGAARGCSTDCDRQLAVAVTLVPAHGPHAPPREAGGASRRGLRLCGWTGPRYGGGLTVRLCTASLNHEVDFRPYNYMRVSRKDAFRLSAIDGK